MLLSKPSKPLAKVVLAYAVSFMLAVTPVMAQQGLTSTQQQQFNQLPPQQRAALLQQLELGNTTGFETPVTQPQTVAPRNGNTDTTADNQTLEDITARDALRVSEDVEETALQRIRRKTAQLVNLGVNVRALDPLGELERMGILDGNGELIIPEDDDAELETEFAEFTEERIRSVVPDREEAIEPFGYNLFAGVPSTFAPATDIPVPPNYIVGPGDTVVLQMYGQRNTRYELAVSREGVMQFPEIGPLNVSGLSFEEMRQLVQQTVANTLIGQEVTVSMGALRSIQIFVLGEAYQPGIYTVSSLATVTNALFFSGGVSELGSLRNIQLIRDGQVITEMDLYDLLISGDTSADARLQPNDVIFIPTVGRTVGISGQVRRPAIFELDGEDTIGDVLALAGGVMPTAFPLLAHVERINQLGQREIFDVNLSDQAGLTSTVRDGDLLHVDPILDQIDSGVAIYGHVYRPGIFAWRQGMRISDILDQDDFRPSPDLQYALLVREIFPSRNIEVHQVNLQQVLQEPGGLEDMNLQTRDRLLVFGENSLENRLDRRLLIYPVIQSLRYQSEQNDFRKVVGVTGGVRSPGDYPLIENMTVEDLLEAAGGAAEYADMNQAELSRFVNTREQGIILETIVLNLTDQLSLNSMVQPLDQLNIRQLPNWGELETVFIGGEVSSPGTYIIGRDDRLSELIERAGGVTQYADPDAGIFLREELRRNEQALLDDFNRQLSRNILNASLTTTGQLQDERVNLDVMNELLNEIENAQPTGRLVVNLPEILAGNPDADVILRDGDQLIIPRTRQEISVIGEVQLPTSHLFSKELDVEDYIGLSGGLNSNADEENIFIIRANGQVVPYSQAQGSWFSFQDESFTLKSGDSIVIPFDADFRDPLITWMSISTVMFNLATTVLALQSVTRIRD